VALLVARGMTNREIAEALSITEGTTEIHVVHILNKLGFRSRTQVAAWAAQHHLLDDVHLEPGGDHAAFSR
jgi:non-specific serine/threonine protein kinase